MKITDLQVQIFERRLPAEHPLIRRWQIWRGDIPDLDPSFQIGVLRVYTDAGIEGDCFVRNQMDARELVQSVKPLVVGCDPLDREWIWQTLWRVERIYHFSIFTHSCIDIALWDIAGKAANLPLCKLLGGYRDKIKAYKSSPLTMSVDTFVQEALKAKARGYHGYKLHPEGDPGKDLAACRAVREAVGDEMDLMLDPIGAYDHEGALKVARELERLGFLWLEEPLPDWDIHGNAELARAVDIPICGVEVLPGSIYGTAEYILQKGVDIVRSDVELKGGITGVMKTAHLSEAFGLNCELHTCLSALSNVANLHCACAMKNTLYFEFLESEKTMGYGVKDFPCLDDEGYVRPPSAPGLGLEIDWEQLGAPLEIL